jgi:3-phosphoshikimate 1-carboxyvinyltransferase
MNYKLQQSKIHQTNAITITGSKSESNRLLLLQALYPELNIENLSNSDDSKVMQLALQSNSNEIDIHHAGTAMRFLTSFFAIQNDKEVVITGSTRMKERPIAVLVDALNQLGAEITYLETIGCPPLKINGKQLTKHKVNLKANVSSQYISALLLIASKLPNGLELTLEGEITSLPYIKMTLTLLEELGIQVKFKNDKIVIQPLKHKIKTQKLIVESDWSSASYFYSIVAISDIGTQISLASYKKNSLQGDAVLAEIYNQFGVETIYKENTIVLKKVKHLKKQSISLDLANAPDIAQTIAVTCLALETECFLSGLHTLKIKETDRLVALKNEIQKCGGKVDITNDTLQLYKTSVLNDAVSISTYNDHRMAMAFAPLALKTNLYIEDAMVVSKSYPTFWNDLETLGIKIIK